MNDLEQKAHRWSIVSSVAKLGAVIVALFTFVLGYWQFSANLTAQQESSAVGLMESYMELKTKSATDEDSYPWEESLAIFYAESIYNLTGGGGGWMAVVREIVGLPPRRLEKDVVSWCPAAPVWPWLLSIRNN